MSVESLEVNEFLFGCPRPRPNELNPGLQFHYQNSWARLSKYVTTPIYEKNPMGRGRDTAQLKDEMSLDLGKCGAQGLTDGPRPILKPDGASGESENNGYRRL